LRPSVTYGSTRPRRRRGNTESSMAPHLHTPFARAHGISRGKGHDDAAMGQRGARRKAMEPKARPWPPRGRERVRGCTRVRRRARLLRCVGARTLVARPRQRTGAVAHGKTAQKSKKRDKHLRARGMMAATPARWRPSLARRPASHNASAAVDSAFPLGSKAGASTDERGRTVLT
jgi:hypothetical protein